MLRVMAEYWDLEGLTGETAKIKNELLGSVNTIGLKG